MPEIQQLRKELEKSRSTSTVAAPAATPASGSAAHARRGPPKPSNPSPLDSVVIRSRRQLEKLHDVPVSVSRGVRAVSWRGEQASDFEAITKRLGNSNLQPEQHPRLIPVDPRPRPARLHRNAGPPASASSSTACPTALSQLGNFDFYDIQSGRSSPRPAGHAAGQGRQRRCALPSPARPRPSHPAPTWRSPTASVKPCS